MNNATDNTTRYLSTAIVTQLLEINACTRDRLDLSNVPPHQLLRDYYTVSLGVARQSGNTRVIKDLAELSDWIFVTNKTFKSLMESSLRRNAQVFTRHDFDGSVIAEHAKRRSLKLRVPQDNPLRDAIDTRGIPNRIFIDATSRFMEFQGFKLSHDEFFKELSMFVNNCEIIMLG